jgi:hypothetical protein
LCTQLVEIPVLAVALSTDPISIAASCRAKPTMVTHELFF